jgi:hypothetical protein
MDAQEKAAEVLDTPATAIKTIYTPILSNRSADRKEYGLLQAEFAALGITLNRSHRAHDGHISYAAIRNGQARYFTHLVDLQNHYIGLMAAKIAKDADDADCID